MPCRGVAGTFGVKWLGRVCLCDMSVRAAPPNVPPFVPALFLRQPATSATRVALVAGPSGLSGFCRGRPRPTCPPEPLARFSRPPFLRQPATSATRVTLVAGPFGLIWRKRRGHIQRQLVWHDLEEAPRAHSASTGMDEERGMPWRRRRRHIQRQLAWTRRGARLGRGAAGTFSVNWPGRGEGHALEEGPQAHSASTGMDEERGMPWRRGRRHIQRQLAWTRRGACLGGGAAGTFSVNWPGRGEGHALEEGPQAHSASTGLDEERGMPWRRAPQAHSASTGLDEERGMPWRRRRRHIQRQLAWTRRGACLGGGAAGTFSVNWPGRGEGHALEEGPQEGRGLEGQI